MVICHLEWLQGLGITVKFLHYNNAGENIKGVYCVADGLGITMEFIAPHTPQQNAVVEFCFVTIR